MYVHLYIYMFLFICIYILFVNRSIPRCIHTYIHTWIYIYINIFIYICIYTHIPLHIYIYTHTPIYIYIYIYTYTHIHNIYVHAHAQVVLFFAAGGHRPRDHCVWFLQQLKLPWHSSHPWVFSGWFIWSTTSHYMTSSQSSQTPTSTQTTHGDGKQGTIGLCRWQMWHGNVVKVGFVPLPWFRWQGRSAVPRSTPASEALGYFSSPASAAWEYFSTLELRRLIII